MARVDVRRMRWSWLVMLALALVACSERVRTLPGVRGAGAASLRASGPPAESGVRGAGAASLRASGPPAGSSTGSPLERDAKPGDPADDAELVLAIPARSQAPEAPPSGWCGETAIQEGLLHLGVTRSQSAINRAGHPTHADLYATEIPRALAELGVRYTPYPGARGYEPYRAWVIEALEAGHPVLAGVKLVPSEHPSWGLDHFVLVVGHGKRGLLVNTTWGHRAWVAEDGASGLSFKGAFYGLRLDGLR